MWCVSNERWMHKACGGKKHAKSTLCNNRKSGKKWLKISLSSSKMSEIQWVTEHLQNAERGKKAAKIFKSNIVNIVGTSLYFYTWAVSSYASYFFLFRYVNVCCSEKIFFLRCSTQFIRVSCSHSVNSMVAASQFTMPEVLQCRRKSEKF